MSWNYRVLRYTDGSLAIHEAFYDEDKETPHSCTADAVGVGGDDLDDLMSTLNLMHRALLRPILDYQSIASRPASPRQSKDPE